MRMECSKNKRDGSCESNDLTRTVPLIPIFLLQVFFFYFQVAANGIDWSN